MTYKETVKYILDIPRFTKKNDAEHTRTFLEYLGRPLERIKVLHVAGTNGKGSVCAYLDGMLRSEGKRTGLFTSPHLVKINERIAVNGVQLSDEQFCRMFERTRKAVQLMEENGIPHPTFFEFLFGMATVAFEEAGVEYAVLETGLGGRLDATSAVQHPLVCVVTSIGLDHMEYLGNTLEEIAGEKAGIIRDKAPVFYAQTDESSDRVIERIAKEQGSFCKKIGKDAFEILGIEDKHIAFSCSSAYYGNTTWRLNNTGVCQPGNAMLAMEVMRYIFGEKGHPDKWRAALKDLKWAGRMEEILPDVYVDGAHNISAVEVFVHSVPRDGRENIVLFSAVEDKDYRKMVECLCRRMASDMFVVTRIDSLRGAQAETLGEIFRQYTEQPVIVKESVRKALAFALENQNGRRIYCLGSLYLTGAIKELIQEVV